MAIAYDDVIENGIGGTGDDLLVGNLAANRLQGGLGNDSIVGGDRADEIIGGTGDTLDGGEGHDFLSDTRGNDVLMGGGGDDYFIADAGTDTIDGGAGDDVISGIGQRPNGVVGGSFIDAGDGNDTVDFRGINAQIYLGAGDDFLKNAGAGSVVQGDGGKDKFNLIDHILIADAEADDEILAYGWLKLNGGLKIGGSESPWAIDSFGLFRYAIDVAGELVIESRQKGADGDRIRMYVGNYVGGPGAAYNSAGIFVAEAEFSFYRLMDPDLPSGSITSQLALVDLQIKPKFLFVNCAKP